MKISVSDLHTERQWRSATGLDKARFYNFLTRFEKAYIEIYGKTLKERLVENDVNYCICNEEELLLFILLNFKSGLTYDLLGLMCGMDGSNAERNQKTGLKILIKALESSGHAPKRNFMNTKDFEEYFSDTDTLKIDATEQRIQRPSDKEKQKEYYSGKKRTHAVKSMIISDNSKRIRYISDCRVGKLHDYRFLKNEFPPAEPWFKNFNIRVDLGYFGIVRDYACKRVFIPHKKPKNRDLTEVQKNENKTVSSARISVEHSIGGLKRYRILSERLRLHDFDLYSDILGACAGLWNFRLSVTD